MTSHSKTDDTQAIPESSGPPENPSSVRPTINAALPGLREYTGRHCNGAEDVRGAIRVLNDADIPACVVGVKALQYYGAGRISWEWDVCIPDDRLLDAVRIFGEHEQYEPTTPPLPVPSSLRHLHPIFKLKEAGFFFILTPSSRCFIDPQSSHCELSRNGVPYPQMAPFARSLLVLQNGADIADFVDGMDLDDAWGEESINFEDLREEGSEFSRGCNKVFLETQGRPGLKLDEDYRRRWREIVSGKEGRIEPTKRGRYKTRWRRIKNDVDPRQRERNM